MMKWMLDFLEKLYQNVEMLQKIVEILKKLWGKITFVISLILILIVCSLYEPIATYLRKYEKIATVYSVIEKYRIQILVVILCGVIIAFLYATIKLGKQLSRDSIRMADFTKKLHVRFFHDLRDDIKDLENYGKKINAGDDKEKIILKEEMFKKFVESMQRYIDFISEYFSDYCGSTISACIKIIKLDKDNQDIDDIKNRRAITLVRSSATKRERSKNNEEVTVVKNSDFLFLCTGANVFYGKADLDQEYSKHQYNVEDDYNTWHSKYISTLITPIRYYNKHRRYTTNDNRIELDILGFLCIDSKKKQINWEDFDSHELQLMAIISDSLYTYMKRFKDIYIKGE